MNRYCIEIVSDMPPRLFIGDDIAGGRVVSIKSDEPDYVSTAWLAEKTGLSKSTITDKLKTLAIGNGKFTYPRSQALQLLQQGTKKRGRKRIN